MNIPDSLLELAVDVDQLVPYRTNPRRGDVGRIAESLEANGQYRPIVVRRDTNEVLAGNHTLLAVRELGWPKVAATFVDVDDDQAARIVLVDNRTNDVAGYDDPMLVDLLQSLEGLTGTGFSEEDLDKLLADVTVLPPALADPDAAPAVPAKSRSKLGDVWLLGPHRLVCGDATDVGAYDALLGGALVDIVWTDPPYGVDYVGKSAEALTIENDGASGLEELLRGALGASFTTCKPGGAWYVACADKAGSFTPFLRVLEELGVYRHQIIWVKDRFVLGRGDYHFRHEPILYGWHPGAARLHPVADRRQDTVWEIPRPASNKDHPTMKPVELIARALENSSDKGDLVLDPFGGSGSTLIAAHLTGRKARLIELDPKYVDVICRRWQEATGDRPVLESTGKPRDFTRR